MSAWNLFSRPQAFALQLSDTQIKLLEVKPQFRLRPLDLRHAGKPTVFFSSALPTGIVVDGIIKDESALIESIEQTVAKARLRTKRVVASMPERQAFIYRLEVDKNIPRSEMTEAIINKAQDILPIDLEACAFDYRTSVELESVLEVTFAAAPSELVASYERTINQSGLKLQVLEPESLAMTRALIEPETLQPEEGIVIISPEAGGYMAIFVDHTGIRLSTVLPRLEAKSLAPEKKKKTLATKAKLKKAVRKVKSAKSIESVGPKFDVLVEEAIRGLDFCEQKYGWKKRRILLAGDFGALPGLSGELSKAIDLEVEGADPMYDLSWRSSDAPYILSGLAMRAASLSPGINFIVPE